MTIQVLKCPNCGALLSPAARSTTVCEFCKATLIDVPVDDSPAQRPLPRAPAEACWRDGGQPRVLIDERRYVLIGRLARGDSSDVFLGRRDAPLTELVVVKALRALGDADLLAREQATLEALERSTIQGADYFARLLPQPVSRGTLDSGDGRSRPVTVYRWRSGFLHTLDEVLRVYPAGVDSRAALWIWKRLLELLGWVHRSGFVHGALFPRHLLIHPRDHGVTLLGWSCATRLADREPTPARSEADRAYYPEPAWSGAPVGASLDLTMSARVMLKLLGGDPWRLTLPASVPPPLGELLRLHADDGPVADRTTDAWELKEQLDAVARQVFGPPRYHVLSMPGWP